jgi:hypothetical protein
VEKGLIMATTTNTGLNQPTYNQTSPTWDQPLNYNETILDAIFGNTTSIALTNANVTLTGPASSGSLGQTQAMRVTLTGTISANITITIPTGISGRWIIYNSTSGAYTITIASGGGGTTVTAPQGYNVTVYSDGTNIRLDNDGLLTGAQAFTSVATNTITAPSGTLAVTGNISPSGRITPRVSVTNAPSSPFAWNSNSYDEIVLTGIANSLTISADSGSPVQGQTIVFRLKDAGTSQTLTWTQSGTASFRQIGAFLPLATVANKTTYVGAIYNSTDGYWDVVAVTTQT